MPYSWVVIGAGPAGILSILKLLDNNIPSDEILWIDEKFQVGRLGQYYRNVPSNDTVEDWIQVLNSYSLSKQYSSTLEQYPPDSSQKLNVIYQILLLITRQLEGSGIKIKKGRVKELKYQRDLWSLYLKNTNKVLKGRKVILATGSHPIDLNFQEHLYNRVYPQVDIPLDLAIDQEKLAQYVTFNDTVAVIGSGQSAVLLLKYLTDFQIKKIVYLYKISLEETVKSLKALTLNWAQKFLLSNDQSQIVRILNTSANREKWLPSCDKIIYAVGFERNPLPKIRGAAVDLEANDGILSTNLLGVGIAFPLKEEDRNGHVIKRVGFRSFSRFLEFHFPAWLNS